MGRSAAQESEAEDEFTREATLLDSLLTLERLALDHEPKCFAEAAQILDIIIPDVEAGGRSDGRDVQALRRIRTLLERHA